MAGGNINLPLVATPGTPAASTANFYVDQTTTTPSFRMVNAAGVNTVVGTICNSYATAQTPAATTRTYITGSSLRIPTNLCQVGSSFYWEFDMTKTGAGTAASTFDICFGTNGTTGDTARVSFTKPGGSAAADAATVTISAVVRTAGASGILVGNFTMVHNLASTGHATIPCVVVTTVSGAFDMTVANSIIGVCITSGLSDAITINQVQATGWYI